MKRVGLLVLLGLLSLSCRKNAPSHSLLPPWQWVVTGMKPGSVAAEPALVVCEANGSDCAPIKPGARLAGNKLVRLERGVSEFELDSATRVEVAEGSELLLQDAPRTLELRAGGISLSRSSELSDAGPLVVKMVDRALELAGRAAFVAHLDNVNRGELFVTRGVVKMGETNAASAARELHPGEGAVFERQAPPDLQAVFAGKVSQLRQTILAAVHAPPPPQAAPEPRGLGTMTARVPGTTAVVEGVRLAQHHVRAVVRDGVAQTEVEEVFQNDTARVLEGRYVFPLPADATISGLTLFVGDKPIDGELVEKKRAAAIFKSIVEDTVRPRDPALLEWVKGSEFSLKVFPIPAKGSRKLILRYQQVLTADGPSQTYVYPLSFGAERRTPIDDLAVDVELSDGGEPVRGVLASGYAATIATTGQTTHVALRASASAPDRDFAVSYRRAAPGATVAAIQAGFVAMRLRAELPASLPVPAFRPRDRVLVIDASHSQSAESLTAERELALGILRSLEPDERFALLLCDSACEAFPKQGLTAATGDVLANAEGFLKARKPTGASDVAGALRSAAERVPRGAAVQIVYLGDGSPSAGELTASSIANRARTGFEQRQVDLRLFGVGSSIDEVTLGALARALGGTYDRVASSGSLADESEALINGLRAPLVVAPTLDVPPSVSELEPRQLPNLRLGQEFVVVGKYAGIVPFNVTLRGRLNGEAYTLLRTVSARATTGGLPFASRLWAESRIDELQSSGDAAALKELIETSKQFGVMSRETSWLVLESEQMFAELGIPRIKRTDNEQPGASSDSNTQADRAALGRELDQLELGTPAGEQAPSAALDDARPSDNARKDAAKSSAPPSKPTRSAPPPAPAGAPAPAPAPAPAEAQAGPPAGAAGGGLAGIDSTRGGSADGIGSSSGSGTKVEGPRGNAILGGAVVSGGTIANSSRVLAALRPGLRACYQRGLLDDPSMAGSLRLTLRVAPNGDVAKVEPNITSGSLSAAVASCAGARAARAVFDPPQGGATTIVLPVTFTQLPEGPDVTRPPGAIAPHPRVPPIQDNAVTRPGDESWLGQGQAALDKLQADLAASPSSRKRHEALVRGLLLRGRFAPALNAAERFVELDPDLPVARELLAYAAVAGGERQRATAAVDTLTENAPSELKAQARAARAFEALGDEARACAHWRSMFELAPTADSAQFEALRCRARVMNDREAALRDAKAVGKPGPLLQRLLPLLDSGQIPAFQKSSGSAGQFEVVLSCEANADCPYAIVITPTGTVFSPWTPALGRSSATSFAFSGLMTGLYRVLLIGGAPNAKGQVEIRALNAHNTFAFAPGHAPTVASTQVTLAPDGVGLLGIGSLSRF